VKINLKGQAGPERYRELHRVLDRHCPVLDLFSNPTRVVTELVAD
jgi:putative redox protein